MRYSRDWMLRLGDGTEESHIRLTNGLDEIWMYFGDLFALAEGEELLIEAGIAPDMAKLRDNVQLRIAQTFDEATLAPPSFDAVMQEGSQRGYHTEYLSYILSEMQSVTRAHPGATW